VVAYLHLYPCPCLGRSQGSCVLQTASPPRVQTLNDQVVGKFHCLGLCRSVKEYTFAVTWRFFWEGPQER
jgi:hypothetical protein